MRQFIISSMAPILWILTAFDAISIFAMFQNRRKNRTSQISLLTGILCLGLFYDSLILSLGAFLPFGPLLKTLSQFRYILHCLLIPLLFPICGYSLKLKEKTIKVIWIITAIIMVIVVQMLDIVPVFFMIGIGIYLIIRKKNPHMFLSGTCMLVFTLLGIFLGKDPSGDRTQSLMFYISMYGESLMVYFLYRFIRKEEA